MNNKSVKQIAIEAAKEIDPANLAKLIDGDETNLKILDIGSRMGMEKGETGPVEFMIQFGRKCWDQGREEMKKEIADKLIKQGLK